MNSSSIKMYAFISSGISWAWTADWSLTLIDFLIADRHSSWSRLGVEFDNAFFIQSPDSAVQLWSGHSVYFQRVKEKYLSSLGQNLRPSCAPASNSNLAIEKSPCKTANSNIGMRTPWKYNVAGNLQLFWSKSFTSPNLWHRKAASQILFSTMFISISPSPDTDSDQTAFLTKVGSIREAMEIALKPPHPFALKALGWFRNNLEQNNVSIGNDTQQIECKTNEFQYWCKEICILYEKTVLVKIQIQIIENWTWIHTGGIQNCKIRRHIA